jgi:F-type H+-transporting ATPase subunit delta
MAGAPKARRYARAAFDIAVGEDRLEGWLQDILRAQEALEDDTLRTYLELRKVVLTSKVDVIRETLSGISPLVQNLIGLLVSRDAVGLLPQIAEEYQRLMDAHLGRERAEVITAHPLEDQQRERLGRWLGRLLGKEVVLTSREDPEVLGGLVVRVGDSIIDGSTKGRLEAMRKDLAELPASSPTP